MLFLGNEVGSVVKFPMKPNPSKSTIVITKIPSIYKNKNEGETIELMAVGTHIPMESAEMLFPGSVNR